MLALMFFTMLFVPFVFAREPFVRFMSALVFGALCFSTYHADHLLPQLGQASGDFVGYFPHSAGAYDVYP